MVAPSFSMVYLRACCVQLAAVYLRACCVQLAAVTLFIYVRVVCSWQLSLVGTERSENSEILRQLESRLFLKLPSHQVHIKACTPRTENMTSCRLHDLLSCYRTATIYLQYSADGVSSAFRL
jgi:hypothetical protein